MTSYDHLAPSEGFETDEDGNWLCLFCPKWFEEDEIDEHVETVHPEELEERRGYLMAPTAPQEAP